MQMDKEGAQPDRVKQELSDAGLLPEEWGGQTPMIQVYHVLDNLSICTERAQLASTSFLCTAIGVHATLMSPLQEQADGIAQPTTQPMPSVT